MDDPMDDPLRHPISSPSKSPRATLEDRHDEATVQTIVHASEEKHTDMDMYIYIHVDL